MRALRDRVGPSHPGGERGEPLDPGGDHGEVHCFLAKDRSLWEDKRTRILYGFSPAREVALYLAEHSGATTREIGQALGMKAAKVRYHLRKLRRLDLAEQCWFEREVIYTATPRLERWVEEVGEGFRGDCEGSREGGGDP